MKTQNVEIQNPNAIAKNNANLGPNNNQYDIEKQIKQPKT